MIDKTVREVNLKDVWNVRHEVMWPSKPLDFIKIDNDDEGLHLGLYENDNLLSIVSVFIDGDQAQFRKLATKEMYQSQGNATLLLECMMEYLKHNKVMTVFCDSRINAQGFYESLGFSPEGDVFIKYEKSYIKMIKNLRE